MWETFRSRALFLSGYGGADFGECRVAVDAVGTGGVDDWYVSWTGVADRLVEAGDSSAAAGHRVSAREAYARATTYYRTGYYPLFGTPVDERLKASSEKELATLAKAAALQDHPVEMVEIPFEGSTVPGVLATASADGNPRPTIVHTNGYDSTIAEMFICHVPAAIERGYNMLLFDGPGQGRNLVRDGLTMRPDWENVVGPVVDRALGRPEVEASQVVLAGWSFGGYLAPRAAGSEPRIAVLWADPGQWDQGDAVLGMFPLTDDDKAHFPDIDPAKLQPIDDYLRSDAADPMLRWRVIQRGLWVNGKASFFDYCADMLRYELSPVAADITCPTLLTAAEGDPIAAGAPKLLAAIGSKQKQLLQFTAAEGAQGHCEGAGRRLFHQRCYDWLDAVLQP